MFKICTDYRAEGAGKKFDMPRSGPDICVLQTNPYPPILRTKRSYMSGLRMD